MGEISKIIDSALLNQANESSNKITYSKNIRNYDCSFDGCERKAYAKGLCNAHYCRLRSGKDMNLPVRARKYDDKCKQCGKITGSKGGWGLCSKHYNKKRSDLIKDACIEALGGKCSKCLKSYHRSVYDFHHIGLKKDSPSYFLRNFSSEKIEKELSECILLCANCHREEHYLHIDEDKNG